MAVPVASFGEARDTDMFRFSHVMFCWITFYYKSDSTALFPSASCYYQDAFYPCTFPSLKVFLFTLYKHEMISFAITTVWMYMYCRMYVAKHCSKNVFKFNKLLYFFPYFLT